MAGKDLNNYLSIVGNFGIYQWLLMLQLGLLIVFFGQQMFATVFTQYTPDYHCIDEINGTLVSNITGVTISEDSCNYTISSDGFHNQTGTCSNFKFDTNIFSKTTATQFGLVCDMKWWSTIITSLYMTCVGVGAIFGSYASDKFGRKPMCILSSFTTGLFGCLSSASVNLPMYISMRCFMGLFTFSGYTAAFTLVSESVAPNKRSQGLNILEIFWVVGTCSLSLIAYLFRDWWEIQLFISVPPLIVAVMYIWTLDESPHWCLINDQTERCLDTLKRMSRWNKVSVEINLSPKQKPITPTTESDNEGTTLDVRGEVKAASSCTAIFKQKRLLLRFTIFCVGWAACSLTYYALSFGVGGLAGDIFLNNFWMCFVEGLAYAACFIIAYAGRKWPTILSFEIGGAALLVNVFLTIYAPDQITAQTWMSIVGKFAISAAWQIIIVWETEVYPTTHRCTLGSLNGLFGRIGGVSAPFLIDLPKYIDVPHKMVIVPSIFVGTMFFTGLLHCLIPETNRCKLPENLQQSNVLRFPLAEEEDASDSPENQQLVPETPTSEQA